MQVVPKCTTLEPCAQAERVANASRDHSVPPLPIAGPGPVWELPSAGLQTQHAPTEGRARLAAAVFFVRTEGRTLLQLRYGAFWRGRGGISKTVLVGVGHGGGARADTEFAKDVRDVGA